MLRVGLAAEDRMPHGIELPRDRGPAARCGGAHAPRRARGGRRGPSWIDGTQEQASRWLDVADGHGFPTWEMLGAVGLDDPREA